MDWKKGKQKYFFNGNILTDYTNTFFFFFFSPPKKTNQQNIHGLG
jgi:hypothetical protein